MRWLDLKEGMELTKRRGTTTSRTKITKVSLNEDDKRVIFETEDRFTEEIYKKRQK